MPKSEKLGDHSGCATERIETHTH